MTEEKDYGIKVGDRVKPTQSFNFDEYFGPRDLDDRGTVVSISEAEVRGPGHTGCVNVMWDGGDGSRDWDHSFGELRGNNALWEADECAIEKVEA